MPDAARDGSDAGADDGTLPGLGMFVDWRAKPALPGVVTDRITVSDATFQLDHLQVLGDNMTDTRTIHSRYLLTWAVSNKPEQERFPDAPVGLYSKISFLMTNGNLGENTYEIHGTWRNPANVVRPFEIRDRVQVPVSLDCSATLPVAGSANLAIRVDLSNALAGIDFTQLEDDDSGLELKEGPQLVAFRARLMDAFRLDD
jgi:hypothetical protein